MNIEEFFKRFKNNRILLVGVGNRLRADDAAGLLAAERINNSRFNVICAESGLENYIGKIIKIRPEIILVIDAVHLNENVGSYRIFSQDYVRSSYIVSHSLSFDLINNLIESTIHSKVYFLGIQPGSIGIGENPTPSVLRTIDNLVRMINSIDY